MLTEKKNRKGTTYFEDESGNIVAKNCAKCNEVKTLDDYPKHKAGLGGRESSCKRCKAGYYAENKADYVRRYESNKEHYQELMRIYYATNKESLSEYQRKYNAENKEYIAERYRKYCDANREYLTELSRNWRRNNPEKATLIAERRRARKQSLPDDFAEDQLLETLASFGGCALTGEASNLHWDHVIPLATGFGGTIFGNMIPLRGDLNTSKNDANIFEWFRANKERFSLSQSKFDRLVEWLASVNVMTTDEYRSFVNECFENKRNAGELGSHSA
jgi:hypothetical protein